MDEQTRAKIALEILELTKPLEPEPDEITVEQFVATARKAGQEFTPKRAKYRLDRAVERGLLTKRLFIRSDGVRVTLYRQKAQ